MMCKRKSIWLLKFTNDGTSLAYGTGDWQVWYPEPTPFVGFATSLCGKKKKKGIKWDTLGEGKVTPINELMRAEPTWAEHLF